MLNELTQKLESVLKKLRGEGKITEKNVAETMRSIRRVLLEADVNYKVAKDFIASVQEKALGQEVLRSITPAQLIVKIINDELTALLGEPFKDIKMEPAPPTVVMVVGLQGSGKTTFCAKLARYLKKKGRSPFLASVDVYRPAARKQLEVLGKSLDIPVLGMEETDPVRIAEASLDECKRVSGDVLILDTAGRLHIDDTMMQELSALKEGALPHEILFVADGMTGQDAVNTASVFLERLDFSGVVLTKLDGDAKGGAALSISKVTGKPIRFISVGEKVEDLEPFHPERMASRILGMGDIVTLVEKAHEAIDEEQAAKLEEKLRNAEFTFDDFLDQLQQLKNMGPIENLLEFIPGMNKLPVKGLQMDEGALKRTEAIISSMT
ncbi:MAG: signal recognition particle protein, partial [bacterium]|nr:signal recognition particle protein [bacterium]